MITIEEGSWEKREITGKKSRLKAVVVQVKGGLNSEPTCWQKLVIQVILKINGVRLSG
jgi:hypothetical protein